MLPRSEEEVHDFWMGNLLRVMVVYMWNDWLSGLPASEAKEIRQNAYADFKTLVHQSLDEFYSNSTKKMTELGLKEEMLESLSGTPLGGLFAPEFVSSEIKERIAKTLVDFDSSAREVLGIAEE